MLYWFEPVLYLDPVSKFPKTAERPGYFVRFVDNVGDSLKFKILKNDLVTLLHITMVRSAADSSHWDNKVSFKSNVQKSPNLSDTKPTFVWKYRHYKYNYRNNNNDESNRTRSKANYLDQYVGSKTRSKMDSVNNLSFQTILTSFSCSLFNIFSRIWKVS
jgi:hypothetical protein